MTQQNNEKYLIFYVTDIWLFSIMKSPVYGKVGN